MLLATQKTKKFTLCKKQPLDDQSRGCSYIIVRISDPSETNYDPLKMAIQLSNNKIR